MEGYVTMTAKEAMELVGEDSIVLVSVQDLTKKNTLAKLCKKTGRDCQNFIDEATKRISKNGTSKRLIVKIITRTGVRKKLLTEQAFGYIVNIARRK